MQVGIVLQTDETSHQHLFFLLQLLQKFHDLLRRIGLFLFLSLFIFVFIGQD